MNPEEQALLQQLNDVALPASPGWWPPAPGWWLLLFGLLLIAAVVYWLFRKFVATKSRDVWRRSALAEHQQLFQSLQNQSPETDTDQTRIIAELSVLMRRVALAVEPRGRIASLTDAQWLSKLDAIGHTAEYSNGVGAILYRHQYQRAQRLDDETVNRLFSLTADTIQNASPELHQSEVDPVAAL